MFLLLLRLLFAFGVEVFVGAARRQELLPCASSSKGIQINNPNTFV